MQSLSVCDSCPLATWPYSMDFKAALQAEIESKKRQLEKLNNETGKKSVKVSDLEKQREEEYFDKQRILEEQRKVKTLERL